MGWIVAHKWRSEDHFPVYDPLSDLSVQALRYLVIVIPQRLFYLGSRDAYNTEAVTHIFVHRANHHPGADKTSLQSFPGLYRDPVLL